MFSKFFLEIMWAKNALPPYSRLHFPFSVRYIFNWWKLCSFVYLCCSSCELTSLLLSRSTKLIFLVMPRFSICTECSVGYVLGFLSLPCMVDSSRWEEWKSIMNLSTRELQYSLLLILQPGGWVRKFMRKYSVIMGNRIFL